jgi:polyisoprenyl-teichoic acid--peptidoglycan teichoic acid transferase
MTIDIDLKDIRREGNSQPPRSPKNKKEKAKKQKKTSLLDPEQKKKRRKKRVVIIILIFLSFIFLCLGFLVYKGYSLSHDLGFRFKPGSLILKEKRELKKDSSEKFTNILLVGLDTRENGGLLNTDTLILASYNHESNHITLLSIPRDFHVEAQEDVRWYVRINSIYSSGEQKGKGLGMVELQKSIERLTGQEIQYYGIIDFNSFVQIIDAVGGIDVNVENSFTDNRYPIGNSYQSVSFKAGPQTMDGETALIYSRSRHSLQNNEGSDYARARRQQKVIIALKDKLLSSESLTNPKTLFEIFSSIKGNIRVSEFELKDIELAIELAEKFQTEGGKTYSFVLDPAAGNYSLVERKPIETGAYAIGPQLGLGEYDDIIEYVETIKHSPEMYSENPKILVYDTGAGSQNAKELTNTLKEEYPFINITFAGTLRSDQEEIVVYSHEEENFNHTISQLAKFLETQLTQKPEYITTNLNGESVTILLGKNLQLKED